MLSQLLRPARSRQLKPLLRAYILAYLSTASPAAVGLLWSALIGKISIREAYIKCKALLRRCIRFDRLPAAFAVLVGGATLLPGVVYSLINKLASSRRLAQRHPNYTDYIIKFSTAFGSAWAGFWLLNSHPSRPIGFHQDESDNVGAESVQQDLASKRRRRRGSSVALAPTIPVTSLDIPRLSGRTMDLTTFAVIRALGIILSYSWHKNRGSWPKAQKYVRSLAAPTFFATSSCIIMWNWFYSPERLPRSYCRWISSAAQIDARLIEALRQCRLGHFVYGRDTGLAYLLGSMARDLGYPEEWGDPAKTIPVPCELYHSGAGRSCEWHAFKRFTASWKFAIKMYLPLNLLVLSRRKTSTKSAGRALVEASRSSAFLAAFVALFYYGVCCARTRVLPHILSREKYTPQMCDGGVCVGLGCMACGWSILLEKSGRQQEIAFFVAPRALATLLPRRYDRKHQQREQVAFAFSIALILTVAQTRPQAVQGVFGRLLAKVFA